MDFPTLLLIALGLAMDASAVALSVGFALRRLTFRPVFRLSFHFGLFQALMLIIGWAAGKSVHAYIQAYDHWVAFILLAYIGGRMIQAGLSDQEEEAIVKDPTRGARLVMLSVATSIDAMAVGLLLALMGVSIWYPSLVIGIVAALCTLLALFVGHCCGAALGRRMEVVGGSVLIAIGFRILYQHIYLAA
ncbi:MAG: manganese efflux pump [Armatimonadetes bacterium]|nr:manganese efflux pump [Armatimonadota bacterium]